MKKILQISLKFVGLIILAGLFWIVGPERIFKALFALKPLQLLLGLGILSFSALFRFWKFSILFPKNSAKDNLYLYGLSSLGGSVSIVGYLAPAARKAFQNQESVKGLVLNRFFEYMATFIVACVCAFCLIPANSIFLYFGLVFLVIVAGGFAVPFFDFQFNFKNSLLRKLGDFVTSVRNGAKMSRKVVPLLVLSLLPTIADFLMVTYVFAVLGHLVNVLYVPVFWASSGLLGFVTFMNAGPNDVATVVLFQKYDSVAPETTTTMIILARSLIFINLILVYGLSELLKGRKKELNTGATPP